MDLGLASGLYVIATPLGNLGDLSPRAREVVSRASYWASESRAAAQRLKQVLSFELAGRRVGLLSYRESSRDGDAERILKLIDEGASVALMSDAGTPTISDPGWHLVDLVWERGYSVFGLPGPSAATLALSMAGFSARRYVFEGFLSTRNKERQEALKRIELECAPVVLYESPHRLLETLSFLSKLQTRPLYIGRELTKLFEESWRGDTSIAPIVWKDKRVQGEFTLVLGPKAGLEIEDRLPQDSIEFIRTLKLSTKTSSEILKHFYPLASKRQLYQAFSPSALDR